MRTFASADLQRNASEIQKAAAVSPVFLSFHDKPRFVMMSLEDYVHLGGVRLIARPEGLPDSVVARIREIADTYPDAEAELLGDLEGLGEGDGPRP